MRIQTVTIDGWKGLAGEFAVHPLMVLSGPNGSGKSALCEAIRWATTGITDAGSGAAYAAPGGAKVAIKADDMAWTRSIEPDGDSWKNSLSVAGCRGGLRDSERYLADCIGSFAPMWRIAEFLALSPDKRREFVLSLCNGSGPDDLGETIQRAMGEEAKCLDAHALDAATRRYMAVLRASAKKTASDQLRIAIADMKDMVNECQAAILAGRRTISTLQDQSARMPAADADSATLGEQRATLLKQRDEVRDELARKDAIERSAQALRDSLNVLVTKVRTAHQVLSTMKSPDAFAAEKGAEIQKLRTEAESIRAKMVDPGPSPEEPSYDPVRHAREALADLNATKAECQAALRDAEARREPADDAIALWTGWGLVWKGEWSPQKLKTDTDSPDHVSDGLIAFDGLMRRFFEKYSIGELCEAVKKAHGEIARADNDIANATSSLADALAAHKAAAAEYQEQMAVRDGECEVFESRHEEACSRETTADNLETEIGTYRERYERLQKDLDELTERRTKEETRLNELLAGESTPRDQLDAVLAGVTVAIQKLDQQIEMARDRSAHLNSIAVAEKQLAGNVAAKAAAEYVLGVLKDVREGIVKGILGPLTDTITDLLAKCGIKAQAFIDLETPTGKPDFSIGWTRDQSRVVLDAMSGGERVLFCAALSAALARKAAPLLRVLMIEAAEIDAQRMPGVLTGLAGLRDEIGNIIVATHLDFEVPEPWERLVFL